jgi:hypothetical protein
MIFKYQSLTILKILIMNIGSLIFFKYEKNYFKYRKRFLKTKNYSKFMFNSKILYIHNYDVEHDHFYE